MLRTLLLATLVALAFAPTTVSAANLCDGYHVCVNDCDGNGVCVVARAGTGWACAGVGLGLQGAVACADAVNMCVRAAVALDREQVCLPIALALP